jgi:hypothetical protein
MGLMFPGRKHLIVEGGMVVLLWGPCRSNGSIPMNTDTIPYFHWVMFRDDNGLYGFTIYSAANNTQQSCCLGEGKGQTAQEAFDRATVDFYERKAKYKKEADPYTNAIIEAHNA